MEEICTFSGKVRIASRREATRRLGALHERTGSGGGSVYLCCACKEWHITSNNTARKKFRRIKSNYPEAS